MKSTIIIVTKSLAQLIYLLSFLAVRKRNLWAFGSGTGFDGNSKYFIQYIIDNCPDIHSIWITRRKHEVSELRRKNIEVYYYLSPKGIYFSLRAYMYIVTGSLSDINFYTSGNARYVQLWHGIGIKSCLWSNKYSNLNVDNRIIGFIKRPSFYIKPDFILGASKMMNQVLADMLKADVSKSHSILYPRCVYLRAPKAELENYIKRWESNEMNMFIQRLSTYKRVFLYMPTYRDKNPHFLREQNWNLSYLNKRLEEQNSFMIVKLHPRMLNDVSFSGYANIIEIDKSLDIYPILPFTDVLITDYSSIYYDYILMDGKSIILYTPDMLDYISSSRDLLMNYQDNCHGVVVHDFGSLIECINGNLSIDYTDLRNKFWGEALGTEFVDLYESLKLL